MIDGFFEPLDLSEVDLGCSKKQWRQLQARIERRFYIEDQAIRAKLSMSANAMADIAVARNYDERNMLDEKRIIEANIQPILEVADE